MRMQSRKNLLLMVMMATVVVACFQTSSVAAFQASHVPPPPTVPTTSTRRNQACFSRNRMARGTLLYERKKNANNDKKAESSLVTTLITDNPARALSFSAIMALCGAILGPFLDSYHSAFGVLAYDEPFTAALWQQSPPNPPALTTVWWVPILFGVAGWLIGWLYIVLDAIFTTTTSTDANSAKNLQQQQQPLPPKILLGISIFTFQYWLSGVLVATSVLDRTGILNLMSVYAAVAFLVLDGSMAGFITSCATALGGPLIEIGLLSLSRAHLMPPGGGYHYNDLGETGFFPLWILPVYFLGGPAVGNLARGFWNALSTGETTTTENNEVKEAPRAPGGCKVCNDTRCVSCPNCDGMGQYVAMGARSIQCTSCSGRGFVICRACFSDYGEDPNDIQAIRELMARMPD